MSGWPNHELRSSLVLILAALAVPAMADPAQSSTANAEPLPAPESEKKVCKSITYTGSRLPAKKVCKTRAEWDAITEQSQEDMRSRQRSSGSFKNGD